MNNAAAAIAIANGTRIDGDLQPKWLASISPYVSVSTATPELRTPTVSMLRVAAESRLSTTAWRATNNPNTPTGTFTQKIQFQPRCSVSRPPITGPTANPSAPTVAPTPIARPRSSSGKALAMIASVAGVISAAPTP